LEFVHGLSQTVAASEQSDDSADCVMLRDRRNMEHVRQHEQGRIAATWSAGDRIPDYWNFGRPARSLRVVVAERLSGNMVR
jgi:hypothetical protein